jgi:hypothetical protein
MTRTVTGRQPKKVGSEADVVQYMYVRMYACMRSSFGISWNTKGLVILQLLSNIADSNKTECIRCSLDPPWTCRGLSAFYLQLAQELEMWKLKHVCLLTFENLNPFMYLAGHLWTGISPSQGLYLQRATQYRNTPTYIQASSGIRKGSPSAL